MINRFVTLCFHRRGIMLLLFVFIALYGTYCWQHIPLEAYPDIAPTTSQVVTQIPGLAAEEIEQQVTIPLERALVGLPGMQIMRSRSTFGLSLITIIFREGTDNYWSRERLLEKLGEVSLPYNAQPQLDALTSPIGEVYRYYLKSSAYNLRELSELQTWKVIPRLKQVPGVIGVANFGGLTTQFLLEFDPIKLAQYHISLQQIIDAVAENNANAGGSILRYGNQGMVIRGVGLINTLRDFEQIQITEHNGVPVFIRDLGRVTLGHKQRRGIFAIDDLNDGVEGVVQMLKNENPSVVVEGIHDAVRELNEHILPKDVKIVPILDRSDLVAATVHTVSHTLFFGMALVTVVLLFFLGNLRAAGIVAATIPLSLCIAFICMYHFKIPANLLSLGAIDFGIIVDGAIVVMENILRRREAHEADVLSENNLLQAVLEVANPIFFGILVIVTAYSVLFAFQDIEYKLFSPMAFAVGSALLGALLVSLMLTPGLSYWAYRKPAKIFHNHVLERLSEKYDYFLHYLIGKSKVVLGMYAMTLLCVIGLSLHIGRDFLPYLDEGSIWLQVTLPPSIALEKAQDIANEMRHATLEFKEVKQVVSQVGRNDDGTDPFSPSHLECAITLKPYKDWPRGVTKQDFIQSLNKRYQQIPGVHVAFTQPIIDGVLDKVAGAHSDLVVKVYGNNTAGARRLADAVVQVLKTVPGAQDVIIDQEPPAIELRIDVDREAIARYGININDVMHLIQYGIGGGSITRAYVEERNYEVALRFHLKDRNTPEALENLLLTTGDGAQVTLGHLAKIYFSEGLSTVSHEMTRRQVTVRLNLRGRDLVSFTNAAKRRINHRIHYDKTRYEIVWGGQLDNQQRAQARLRVIVPLLLGTMFILLFSQFSNLRHPSLILLSVPLAMFGGLISLELRGMTLNVSSSVGFIALFGVVILNAIIMITNLNKWTHQEGVALKDAVIRGAKERMRPVLMTATVAAIGMVPAATMHGLGSDVQRPLATVIVGGLITATALTLILLPALYFIIETHYRTHILRKNHGA